MSSYLDKTGLERVWSKATDKFATIATTDELKGNIETLTSTKADKTEVETAVAGLVDSAPETLNTLNELAAALGDDPNFATTIATEVGKKVNSSEYNDAIAGINANIASITPEKIGALNKEEYLGPVVLEGNPIVYESGTEGLGIAAVSYLEPKQEGSGDPYPAGGGKNLIPPEQVKLFSNDAYVFFDNPITLKAGHTYTFSLNHVANGIYFVKGGYDASSNENIYAFLYDKASLSYTPHEDCDAWLLAIFNDGTPANLEMQLEIGPAATEYAPYSNIRPISGYNAVELNHVGKNLLEATASNDVMNGVTKTINTDGSITLAGTCTAIFGAVINDDLILPDGNYKLVGGTNSYGLQIWGKDSSGAVSFIAVSNGSAAAFTTDHTKYAGYWIHYEVADGKECNDTLYPAIFLESDADVSFAPYQGTLHIADFGKNLCPVESVENVEWAIRNEGLVQALNSLLPGTYTFSAKWRVDKTGAMAATDMYGIVIENPDRTNIVFSKQQWGSTGIGLIREHHASFTITADVAGKIPNVFVYGIGNDNVGAVGSATIFDIQIESGSLATPYCPYNAELRGKTGGVVYGGKMDWLTGKLTAEWACLGFDGSNILWEANNGSMDTLFYLPTSFHNNIPTAKMGGRCMCTHAPSKDAPPIDQIGCSVRAESDAGIIYLNLGVQAGAYEFNQYVAENGVQIAYELATPIEIQLTPTQISELEGINTLYGDGSNIRAIFNTTGGASPVLESISGILPVEKGGTGSTNAAEARNNLDITPQNIGALPTTGGDVTGRLVVNGGENYVDLSVIRKINGSEHTACLLPNSTTGCIELFYTKDGTTICNYLSLKETYTAFMKPVDIASGGTGAADAATARSNLGITPANIGAAPTSHASTATTYGAASASNYGHAMASSTTPKANGTAAVGSETAKFARGDHVHPLQTSVSGSSGSCTGNAATATTLQTTRSINGTNFNGSANITTANWGTARTISISSTAGTTGTSINGSANASLVIPTTLTGFSSISSTSFSASSGKYYGRAGNLPLLVPAAGDFYFQSADPSNTSGDSNFRKKAIKFLCNKNANFDGVVVGRYHPNSHGILVGDIYDSSTIDSTTGLPQYSTFWGSNLGGNIVIFGTENYNYYERGVLDSSNYIHYTVKQDGTGASGTWGISISGNAATATSLSGTLAVNKGGTGITSNPSMLVNLGSTSAASVFAASPRPGITGTLGIGNGGTGATSKSGARTNLGITSGTSLPSSASAGDIFFLYS